MLGPVWFRLGAGNWVQPFAVAPWADDDPQQLATLPPILRRLGGEWPCVPFGNPGPSLPDRWLAGLDRDLTQTDPWPHGFSANHRWRLLVNSGTEIMLSITYPDDHPVQSLTRVIAKGPDLSLNISLTIKMRKPARLPLGLHPVFALPDTPGMARLRFSALRSVHSFPIAVEPGQSVLRPNQQTPDLNRMETISGATFDVTRLPLAVDAEELLMVEGHDGCVDLTNHQQGYRTTLNWNKEAFPSCLLWISNGGRKSYPWNGRFRAIGIEPIVGVFDLGDAHCLNPASPLARFQAKRVQSLTPDAVYGTNYCISVEKV